MGDLVAAWYDREQAVREADASEPVYLSDWWDCCQYSCTIHCTGIEFFL